VSTDGSVGKRPRRLIFGIVVAQMRREEDRLRVRTFLSVVVLTSFTAFGGTLTTGAAVAWADAPSAADKETARHLMNDGNTAFAAGDFKKALEAFAGAHAIMNLPTTGLGLMRSQEKLGLLVEARDTALGITRIPAKPGEPKPEQGARDEARALAEALATRIPSLEVSVTIDGSVSFVVVVDGTELPQAAATLPRKANPGTHEVVVRARGFLDAKQTVVLSEGQQTQQVSVAMARDPNFKEPDVHPIVIEKPKPDVKPLVPVAPPESHGAHPLLWVGVATTGVGLALGASTGIAVLVTKKKCANDKTPSNCPIALANVSNVGFAVAGVGAVLTAVGIGLSVGHGSEPKKGATIVPELGLGYAGVRGTF
jgi:hypothetical protein